MVAIDEAWSKCSHLTDASHAAGMSDHMLTLGLRFLQTLVTVPSDTALIALLSVGNGLPGTTNSFLEYALETWTRLPRTDEEVDRVLAQPPFWPEADQGPRTVWEVSYEESDIGAFDKGDWVYRCWGYTMWDYKRLRDCEGRPIW